MSDGVRCMWMRGGTSKGGVFLADDLPSDTATRNAFLLGVMGSPDPRQIDGLGGADPLTSKVAIVSTSARDDADIEYLFLQVFVDQALVTDAQGCGNMLAAVGPFAIERGLVPVQDGETSVRIYMANTGKVAVARVATPDGRVTYRGEARIDGVPATAAAVPLEFLDVAGSSCGALLPTGRPVDMIDGLAVTCIDNGMPVVVLAASDIGITGYETREELDANTELKARLEVIRLIAGPMMNLGDVTQKSVPKMTIVAPSRNGGAITTRTFIPHRCHASIGVFGAVSVATACLLPGAPVADIANVPPGSEKIMLIEHPSGATPTILSVDEEGAVTSAGMLRTARKLFDGEVFAQ